MKWKTLALVAVLAAPIATLADKPSTQPSQPRQGGKGDFFNRMGRRDGTLQPGPGPGQKATQQEIDEALAFVRETAPNHYELFNRLPEGGPKRNRAEQIMVMRYRGLMRVQDQNPEAYDAMLQQWKFEDQAIGFARAVREGKQPDADVRLREVVRQMVESGLQDRRARIEKLRRALDDQQKQLDQDEQNKDQMIAQRVTQTQTEFERMIRDKDRGGASGEPKDPGGVNALTK